MWLCRALQSLVGSLTGFIAVMVCLDDRIAAAYVKEEEDATAVVWAFE